MPVANCTPFQAVGQAPGQRRSGPDVMVRKGANALVTIGLDGVNPDGSDSIPPVGPFRGEIDTGSAYSAIDSRLAQQLGLPVVDVVTVSTSGGLVRQYTYMGTLRAVGLDYGELGPFAGAQLEDDLKFLLGRSFLRRKLVFYDGYVGTCLVCD